MTGNIALSFNLDAELFWLKVDPTAVDRPKTLSLGRYAITRGVDRIRGILKKFDATATWFVPGDIASRHTELVKILASEGHEIASRSWGPISLGGKTYQEQEKQIRAGKEALEQIIGKEVRGFRAPSGEVDGNTFRVLKDLNVGWSSCLRGSDKPQTVLVDETPTVLDIGSRWELTDYVHFTFNFAPAYPAGQTRYASYAAVLDEWISDARETTSLGLPCVFTLTPDVIGKPGRSLILEKLLEAARDHRIPIGTLGEIEQATDR